MSKTYLFISQVTQSVPRLHSVSQTYLFIPQVRKSVPSKLIHSEGRSECLKFNYALRKLNSVSQNYMFIQKVKQGGAFQKGLLQESINHYPTLNELH